MGQSVSKINVPSYKDVPVMSVNRLNFNNHTVISKALSQPLHRVKHLKNEEKVLLVWEKWVGKTKN